MEPADVAPLPATLEDAITELRNLRNLLYRERKQLVKVVERRELDNRSFRGQIKCMNEQNQELREQIQSLRKRLEQLVTKDTPFI